MERSKDILLLILSLRLQNPSSRTTGSTSCFHSNRRVSGMDDSSRIVDHAQYLVSSVSKTIHRMVLNSVLTEGI